MSEILILDEESQNKNSLGDDQIMRSKKEGMKFNNNPEFINKLNDIFISLQKVKIKEKVIFYRLLATMINAGISLMKAVSILEKQEKNVVLKRMLSKIHDDLKE